MSPASPIQIKSFSSAPIGSVSSWYGIGGMRKQGPESIVTKGARLSADSVAFRFVHGAVLVCVLPSCAARGGGLPANP